MTKNEAIKKALTRLVELKERKAQVGKDNTYIIEKPLAWDAAKKALMMPDDAYLLQGGPDVAAHDEIARLQRELDIAVRALKLAAIRLGIMEGRARYCHSVTGNHELMEEAEMFTAEAQKALKQIEGNHDQ